MAKTDEKKVCPSCQKDNVHDATVCAHCGNSLIPLLVAQITEPVPEKLFEAVAGPPGGEAPTIQRSDGITLVVRGHEEPIVVSEEDVIVGRYDPNASQPTVDLSPFNAGPLGVSRRHARIHRQNDIYLIEDLKSTNGTWINQARLPAEKKQGLHSGAILQFGQLVLYFYENSIEAVRSVEEHISFRNKSAKLTPHYLATHVCPYLTALAGVQAVCDELLKHPPSAAEIGAIELDGPDLISVRMTGVRDAVKLAKGQLKRWRTDHKRKIDQLGLAQQKPTQTLAAEATDANKGAVQSVQQLQAELRVAEAELALEFVRAIAPHRGDDHQACAQKLVEPLHVLAISSLHVATGTGLLVS